MLYKVFIKPFLFALHPEFAHDFTLWILKKLFYIPCFKQFVRLMYCVEDPRLEKELFGIKFKNPSIRFKKATLVIIFVIICSLSSLK